MLRKNLKNFGGHLKISIFLNMYFHHMLQKSWDFTSIIFYAPHHYTPTMNHDIDKDNKQHW
jgi:hypothetical protein